MQNKRIVLGLMLIACALLSGCTYRYGQLTPNSQFAYANSNVTPLGHVHGEVSKGTWIWYPSLTVSDVKSAYNDALKKAEGANILINFKEDTEFLMIPIPLFTYYRVKYTLDGEAAKMEVGSQELR